MKVLIIRLSSLGDIIQCLPAVTLLKKKDPNCEIHWLVRSDFADSLRPIKHIDRLWDFNKKLGLLGFVKFCFVLKNERFTHIYDAHSNLRSHIASVILRFPKFQSRFIRRGKQRWNRFLLFNFGINRFPKPFKASQSFISPLSAWGIDQSPLPPKIQFDYSEKILAQKDQLLESIAIAPSAAWELKRWPASYWKELISQMPNHRFYILGGPQDIFCEEIASEYPDRAVNFAGKLSWNETFQLLSFSKAVVSGDTGVMHMADLLHRPTLALIGPTAFGYPGSDQSHVSEMTLTCKPCSKDGRGKCKNKEFKKCLVDIKPEFVARKLKAILAES